MLESEATVLKQKQRSDLGSRFYLKECLNLRAKKAACQRGQMINITKMMI